VCLLDLDDDEKQFIDEWINVTTKSNNNKSLKRKIDSEEIEPPQKKLKRAIKWNDLREDLRKRNGRFRSENVVKNYWYSKQRSLKNGDERGKKKYYNLNSKNHAGSCDDKESTLTPNHMIMSTENHAGSCDNTESTLVNKNYDLPSEDRNNDKITSTENHVGPYNNNTASTLTRKNYDIDSLPSKVEDHISHKNNLSVTCSSYDSSKCQRPTLPPISFILDNLPSPSLCDCFVCQQQNQAPLNLNLNKPNINLKLYLPLCKYQTTKSATNRPVLPPIHLNK
jgi:hypothetical protein